MGRENGGIRFAKSGRNRALEEEKHQRTEKFVELADEGKKNFHEIIADKLLGGKSPRG